MKICNISPEDCLKQLIRTNPDMSMSDIEWFIECLSDWDMLSDRGLEMYDKINKQIYKD